MATQSFAPLNREEFILVSKLEAAERQLDQAILLFFGKGDQVSTHTLAAAAYQIISDICKHKRIEREIEDSKLLDDLGIKRELLASIRKPQNFFKHADNDPEQKVRLKPFLTVCNIMSSVQYMLKLRSKPTPECEVFRAWFFLQIPECTPPGIKATTGANKVSIDTSDYQLFLETIDFHRKGGAVAA